MLEVLEGAKSWNRTLVKCDFVWQGTCWMMHQSLVFWSPIVGMGKE
jgi:hypothetical protein